MANIATITSSSVVLCSSNGAEIFNTSNKYLYEDSYNPFWFIQGGKSIAMDIDSQLFTGNGGGGRFNMKTNFNDIISSVTYSTYQYNSTWYIGYNKLNDTDGVYVYYKKFGVL